MPAKVEARYWGKLAAGVDYAVWFNTTGHWLHLAVPGAAEPVQVGPGCRMAIAAADLAGTPGVEAWLEGLELAGKLRRVG